MQIRKSFQKFVTSDEYKKYIIFLFPVKHGLQWALWIRITLCKPSKFSYLPGGFILYTTLRAKVLNFVICYWKSKIQLTFRPINKWQIITTQTKSTKRLMLVLYERGRLIEAQKRGPCSFYMTSKAHIDDGAISSHISAPYYAIQIN